MHKICDLLQDFIQLKINTPVHLEEHSPPVQRQMGCVTIKSDSVAFVYWDNGTDPYEV